LTERNQAHGDGDERGGETLEISEEGVASVDTGSSAESSRGDGVGEVTDFEMNIRTPLSP
jgi:hypothetical protein